MKFSNTLSLNCPHCYTKTQFTQIREGHKKCKIDNLDHIAFSCTNCDGIISTKWKNDRDISQIQNGFSNLEEYYPIVGEYNSRILLELIKNKLVKEDFLEAIRCYNNGFYNASMLMSRRSIQQELLDKGDKGDNLYKQIESVGISNKLKQLLHKVKNFGNFGAHPDFSLFDEKGESIEDKKGFAKLSLEFLDRYFIDEYETDILIENAPKSKKELENNN